VALVRAQVARVRPLVRRSASPDVSGLLDDLESRVRHLEVALEQAYERIAVLEVMAEEAVAAVDHQGARLEAIDGAVRRARASSD
jgi:hypothetical protein